MWYWFEEHLDEYIWSFHWGKGIAAHGMYSPVRHYWYSMVTKLDKQQKLG